MHSELDEKPSQANQLLIPKKSSVQQRKEIYSNPNSTIENEKLQQELEQ